MNFCHVGMLSGVLLFGLGCPDTSLCAETPIWQPSAGHKQIPIWPGTRLINR